MLFFHRIKLGRYGKFYGTVATLPITSALADFWDERAVILDRAEQKKREEERERWRETAVSREEYERLKAQGKISFP